MSTPRLQLAQVISKKSAGKKLAREVAAYLLDNRKVADLDPLMRDVWGAQADKGYVEAVAVSAHPLSAKVINDIKSKVRKIYPSAKQIVVTTQFDPEVIGGIRLELPHQQLDLTVGAKIDEFKQLTTEKGRA
jgi:F0F1-type ATP synthase delta subunit